MFIELFFTATPPRTGRIGAIKAVWQMERQNMPIPFLPALKERITSPRTEKMWAIRLRLSRRETIQIRGASTTSRREWPYLGLVRADARAFRGTGHCQCYLGVRCTCVASECQSANTVRKSVPFFSRSGCQCQHHARVQCGSISSRHVFRHILHESITQSIAQMSPPFIFE